MQIQNKKIERGLQRQNTKDSNKNVVLLLSCSHYLDFDEVLGCRDVIRLPNHMETRKKEEGLGLESKKDRRKRKRKS